MDVPAEFRGDDGGIAGFDQTQAKAIAAVRKSTSFYVVTCNPEGAMDFYCSVQNLEDNDETLVFLNTVGGHVESLYKKASELIKEDE